MTTLPGGAAVSTPAATASPVASEPLRIAGWGAAPHWGVYAALFLVSLGLLTLEISLTRLFSYTIWYHFAYLTISVALLGFGSSGAIVSAFPEVFRRGGQRLLVWLLVIAAALVVVALLVLIRFPLEADDVLQSPVRFCLSLLAYYAVVGAPFMLAGFAVALPFSAYPRLMGRLYFCDLLGAALGCLLVVAAIEQATVPGLILTAAALLLAGAGCLTLGAGGKRSGWSLVSAALVLASSSARIGNGLDIRTTSTKQVSTANLDDSRTDHYFKWTALSRVDAFDWERPSRYLFWGGNGIAEVYRGPRPAAGTLTYDGGNGSNIYAFRGSFADYAMLDVHILRTPYLLTRAPDVLVVGVGGGIDMLNAIKQGARHVTGVELQPETVRLLKERLRGFTGGFYDREDVTLVAGEGRHWVRKTTRRFDLIQITGADTFAAQATGAYVLAESYLYTVEAMRDYLARLSEDGLLSMVVGDFTWQEVLPPHGTRLAVIARRALEEVGAARPEDHLFVLGSRRNELLTENLLAKKSPFTSAEVRTLEEFATANGFVVLYAPQLGRGGVQHRLTPALAASEPERQRLLGAAWYRMDAVRDRSPFYYNVAKWRNFSASRSLSLSFPGSFIGQLVLLLMIVQSTALGVVLIVLPLLRGAREGLETPGVAAYLAYFLALGIGFMFIEISFIQYFVLFLGSPTYALSVTIFALLLFSSLGSLLSTRFVAAPERALRRLVLLLTALVLVYAAELPRLFDAFLHLDLGARVLIAIAAQLPMGLTLGMFMPLGIACVGERRPRLVPWAWGINGIGSVIGTTLAVVLAMAWSFTLVAVAACALYLGGTALLLAQRRAA